MENITDSTFYKSPKWKRKTSFRAIASAVRESAVCLQPRFATWVSGWVSWRIWSPDWQGLNEVRWRPGQEASLAPPVSNLRSSGCKCTVLKNVRVTLLRLFDAPAIFQRPRVIRRPGNCAPLAPSLRPWLNHNAACKKLQMYMLANNLPLCDENALNVLD